MAQIGLVFGRIWISPHEDLILRPMREDYKLKTTQALWSMEYGLWSIKYGIRNMENLVLVIGYARKLVSSETTPSSVSYIEKIAFRPLYARHDI